MASTNSSDYPGMLPPPPGVTPNLSNPDSIAWKLILAAVLCPVLTTLFWLLRLYTSRCIVRKTHLDDWLIALSLVFAIGLSAVDISQTHYGMGIHMWDISPANFQHVIIVGIPASITYNLATLFAKASILFFYLRFAAASRPFRLVAYSLLVVIAVYSLNAAFSFLYLCTPINRLWDFSVQGTCIDLYTAFLASSILNAITDVILLLLPIWLIQPLRVPLGRKIAIGLVLMAGGFACSVSFIRLAAIPAQKDVTDTTWVYCVNNIWCLVEIYVSIICACLPSLKAFSKHHFPGVFNFAPDRPSHERVNLGIYSSVAADVQMWRNRRRQRNNMSHVLSDPEPGMNDSAAHQTKSETEITTKSRSVTTDESVDRAFVVGRD